jgi:transcription antitermination factor NusG
MGKVFYIHQGCFPSYLFVSLDLDGEQWKAAVYTRGVSRLLPRSITPVAVPTPEVIELREAELAGALVTGKVVPGKRLKVWRGTLAKQVVRCLSVDDEAGLVKALWSCLGRQVSTTLRLDEVTVSELRRLLESHARTAIWLRETRRAGPSTRVSRETTAHRPWSGFLSGATGIPAIK